MPYSAPSIGSTNGCISADVVHNDAMSPLFQAVVEATEEAVINSLFMATDTVSGNQIRRALPIDDTLSILKKYNKFKSDDNDDDDNNQEDDKIGCNTINTSAVFAAFLILPALAIYAARQKKYNS